MTRPLLLGIALLALTTAAHAQGLVEEFPGGIEKPATWRERVPFRPYQPRPGVNLPPPVTRTAPVTTFSSQTVIYGGGYRGGYRGGYGYGDSFPQGEGFGGPRPIYRGGWLMPHRFSSGYPGHRGSRW